VSTITGLGYWIGLLDWTKISEFKGTNPLDIWNK